jgi:hypothetical protein
MPPTLSAARIIEITATHQKKRLSPVRIVP